MIQRFNREQMVSGLLSIGAGFLILLVTWAALRAVLSAANYITPFPDSAVGTLVLWLMAALVGVGWYQWWRMGDRFHIFKDEIFHAALRREHGDETNVVSLAEGEEVSGVVSLFAQIFLRGPRLIFTGIARLQSRFAENPEMEERMGRVLQLLGVSKKWQPALVYEEQAEELGALIRCGLVDFSASKMLLKAASTETTESGE